VKIVCLVLVVRRPVGRRSIRAHHHSRGGKHDFNEGESVLSREKSKRRQEFSLYLSGLAQDEKAINEERKQIFMFFGCHVSTHSRRNFWIKKAFDTEREKETNDMEREREILLILLVGVFSFVGRMFLSFLFRGALFVF